MAITKEQKKEVLDQLIDKFSRSKSVVFSDYRGLDVAGMSELRSELREADAECKVAKKTLIGLAAKDQGINEIPADAMEGPVATTFSYEDELSGLKVLFKFAKKNENLKLLGGIVDGKVLSADEINALAQLPGKEELYAKLIGSMNAPVSGFVGIMGNLVGGLVRVLNAYKDTLPAEGSESVEAEDGSAPAAEAEPAASPESAEGAEAPEEAKDEAPAEGAAEEAPEEPKAEESTNEEAPTETPEEPKADEPAEGTEPAEAAAEEDASETSEEEDDAGDEEPKTDEATS